MKGIYEKSKGKVRYREYVNKRNQRGRQRIRKCFHPAAKKYEA